MPSSDFIEKTGQYFAYLVLVVVHELGHVILGAMRGWKVKSLTFGVLCGLCEFRQDGPDEDTETYLKSDIIVSWGGVIPEILILLTTIYIHSKGLWPEGLFFKGVFKAFTIFAAASVVLNLLPLKGYDGETAWKWFRWKKHLRKCGKQ